MNSIIGPHAASFDALPASFLCVLHHFLLSPLSCLCSSGLHSRYSALGQPTFCFGLTYYSGSHGHFLYIYTHRHYRPRPSLLVPVHLLHLGIRRCFLQDVAPPTAFCLNLRLGFWLLASIYSLVQGSPMSPQPCHGALPPVSTPPSVPIHGKTSSCCQKMLGTAALVDRHRAHAFHWLHWLCSIFFLLCIWWIH